MEDVDLNHSASLEAKISLDMLRRLVVDAVWQRDFDEASRLAAACAVVEARFRGAYTTELQFACDGDVDGI